jgi:cytosine/adenosine deaminase-related metal-dependent hydrolase
LKLIKADFILTCDDEFKIIKNGAVAFDKKIKAVGTNLEDRYEYEEIIATPKNTLLLPGLINIHTHLEFGKNKTTLAYGGFLKWLYSVIDKREEIVQSCKGKCYDDMFNQMIDSGITSFGVISSFGTDHEEYKKTKQKVVYFNEVIGSNPASVDVLFADFKARLEESKKHTSDTFIPAIAIHSPYSVHPILVKHVLDIAKKEDMVVSTHFLESKAEKKWLDSSDGEFKEFFKNFLQTTTSVNNSFDFLDMFDSIKSPIYIHCVYANEAHLKTIKAQNGYIGHCPVSNRLLGSDLLDLEALKSNEIKYTVATDGLSSNYSLNLFKEIRASLLQQVGLNLQLLSRDLIFGITNIAAKALRLHAGQIKEGFDADIITIKLPDSIEDNNDLALHAILHTNCAEQVFINGEQVK